jgi:hypothetical protein
MKLFGVTDGKKVIASMSHYDYISLDGLVADGGQPLTNHYGGYSRFWGERVWFEVPQGFDELYYDYNCCNKNRKYGIWNIEDVRILKEVEYPDVDSVEEKSENFIWGTRGVNGDELLKYVLLKNCSADHLQKIIANVKHLQPETEKVIWHLLAKKTV